MTERELLALTLIHLVGECPRPPEPLIEAIRAHLAQPPAEPQKLWRWKNFVDGNLEYWAFDNPFPIHMDCGDPQTLGEPCGYAINKPSRQGRTDVSDAEVLRRINAASPAWLSAPTGLPQYPDMRQIDATEHEAEQDQNENHDHTNTDD